MYKNLLSTKDIINRFGNNCEVDLRIDLTVLKAQVHIIRMSKAITDFKRLVEITGISGADLNYILQHKEPILRKWQKICKSALNSTHSDDCDGIDALIIEWISQYRTKPAPLAIKSIAMNLADILSIYPYFIKPHVWTKINEIFDQSNDTTNNQNCRPLSLLAILKKDGKRILMPETYKRFLKSIGDVSTVEENNAECSKQDLNNKDLRKEKNEKSRNTSDMIAATSSRDFPPLMAINLVPENATTNVITIEDEPLEYTSNEIKSNTLSAKQTNTQIIDDNNVECLNEYEQFSSVKEEAEDNENSILSVKQEKEFMEDNKNFDSIEILSSDEENTCEDIEVQLKTIKKERMAETTKQIEIQRNHGSFQKDEARTICHGVNDKVNERLDEAYVRKRLKKDIKLVNDDDGGAATKSKNDDANNKQTEVQPNQNIYYQEIKIENTSITSVNVKNEILDIEELNSDMNVATNIYPMKYLKEDVNINEDAVKQEPIEENQLDNFEVSTFADLFSDDDEPDTKTNLIARIEGQLKRSIHERDDDLPSTSQSTISNYHPYSSEFCKKLCLSFVKTEDETDVYINSKVQVYDCLHSIKRYLQSQNDTLGVTFVTDIMISFMLCDDTHQ